MKLPAVHLVREERRQAPVQRQRQPPWQRPSSFFFGSLTFGRQLVGGIENKQRVSKRQPMLDDVCRIFAQVVGDFHLFIVVALIIFFNDLFG